MTGLGSAAPLVAEVRAEGRRLLVLSPCVGWWCDAPFPGTPVAAGSRIGTVERLNARIPLVLPEGLVGTVSDAAPRDRRVAVDFGEVLFELLEALRGKSKKARAGRAAASAEGVPEGCWVVRAPTDGVFYRRRSPDAAPFVEVGGRVRAGQPVGLVEAMKTFNQIVFDGAGIPEEAEVVEIRASDSAEVRSGQILVVVR